MQQREVGYDIQTTALFKRGNEINNQFADIKRVKEHDDLIQETLHKKTLEENHIHSIKQAAEAIRAEL